MYPTARNQSQGDALFAAELALSLEKLNYSKLMQLRALAEKHHDFDLQHFTEDHLLFEQSADVKSAAVLVSELARVGKGHGVWHVDYRLREQYGDASFTVGNATSPIGADGATGA